MSQLSIYITSAWLCLILCMVRRRGRIAGMRHKQSSWILLPEIWMAARSNCLMSLSPLHLFSLSISLALLRSALSPSVSLAAKWLNSPVSFWMQFKDQTLWSHGCGMHWQHTHTYTVLRSTDIDVQKTSEFYVYALNLASSSALTIRLEGDNCNCCIKSSWQAMNRVLKARI